MYGSLKTRPRAVCPVTVSPGSQSDRRTKGGDATPTVHVSPLPAPRTARGGPGGPAPHPKSRLRERARQSDLKAPFLGRTCKQRGFLSPHETLALLESIVNPECSCSHPATEFHTSANLDTSMGHDYETGKHLFLM